MGWRAHDLPNENWKLWTRGGTEGVYVANNSDDKIDIPADLLRGLVADDVRSQQISKAEQATDNELLGLE